MPAHYTILTSLYIDRGALSPTKKRLRKARDDELDRISGGFICSISSRSISLSRFYEEHDRMHFSNATSAGGIESFTVFQGFFG
jgi:hypothetical protein